MKYRKICGAEGRWYMGSHFPGKLRTVNDGQKIEYGARSHVIFKKVKNIKLIFLFRSLET